MATVKLPHEFIRWIPEGPVEELLNLMKEGSQGKYYFVEVDIAPLEEKYEDTVSELPLFPENREVLPGYLSEDQLYRWKLNTGKDFDGDVINCVTFFEKKNYICRFSYLKQAFEVGCKITKTHNIAKFKADHIMADYVKKNLSVEERSFY